MSLSVLLALASQAPSFPPATPESQGLETAWLESLCRVVQGYVERDEIVGAQLFQRRIWFASAVLGTLTERWEDVETGLHFPPELFEPPPR